MHLPKVLFVFFYLAAFICRGQSVTESIKALLHTPNDSLRVELMVKLSKEFSAHNTDSTLFYAMEAETLAKELENPYLLATALSSKGVAFYYLNDIENSNEQYFEALTIFDSLQNKKGTARALNNIAWNYKVQEMSDEAIDYFNQALVLGKEINDIDLIQGILNNLGTVYRNEQKYDSALEVFSESLQLNQQSGNKKWEAYNLNNIGSIYLDKNEYQEALNYYKAAEKVNIDNDYLEEYTRNLLNTGRVYSKMKNYAKADFYYDQVHTKILENGFKRVLLEYYENMVEMNTLKESFQEALFYQRKQDSLNNALNRIEFNKKVGELQTKYELARQERDIEEYEMKVNRQKFVIFGGTTMFLLLLSLLLVVLKLYKAKNLWAKNVEQLNNEIQEKAEELKSINEEIQGVNNNLERMVAERTEEIKEQNQKLVKYAFINSHEIRGPLARVLGLVYLMGLEKKKLHKDISFKLLNESAEELDEVVKSASKLLEDKDFMDQM